MDNVACMAMMYSAMRGAERVGQVGVGEVHDDGPMEEDLAKHRWGGAPGCAPGRSTARGRRGDGERGAEDTPG